MKQFNESKSSSVPVIATVLALALVGFSAISFANGSLASHLHMWKKSKKKIDSTEIQIEDILAENIAMRRNADILADSLDKMLVQNKRLMTSNKEIGSALEEEHERVVKLMNVINEENEEKLVLTQKLEEVNKRLLGCTARKSDKDKIHEKANNKESIA